MINLDELVATRDRPALHVALRAVHPADIADFVDGLGHEDRQFVFSLLTDPIAAEVIDEAELDTTRSLAESTSSQRFARVVQHLEADDAAELMTDLDPETSGEILEALSEQAAAAVEEALNYPEGTAGRLMTTSFVALRAGITVGVALEDIRRQVPRAPSTYYLYVVDAQGVLVGVLSLRGLVGATPDATVGSICAPDPVKVLVTDDQELVAQTVAKYDLLAVPVVDEQGRLVGMVTVDDVVDVMREEATEDIHKMGASSALGAPYLRVGILAMLRKRAGWLAVLFVGEMLTTAAMGYYEAEIARAVVLALFVPLIISSGGNSGSQAATLVIRAMTLAEIGPSDWWRIVWRELASGLGLGLILGFLGIVRILGWQAMFQTYGDHYAVVAATVAASLLGVVTWGTLMGSMMPLLLRRLGFDPASASAPFVATLVDVFGVAIYFTIARAFLTGTLL